MDGQGYEMPIHGFAPQSRFHLIHKSEDSMTFELRSSEETLNMYPRNFAFRVVYALSESTLSVRSVSLSMEPLVVSDSEANFWSITMMIGVPVLTVLIGFVLWLRRRKR